MEYKELVWHQFHGLGSSIDGVYVPPLTSPKPSYEGMYGAWGFPSQSSVKEARDYAVELENKPLVSCPWCGRNKEMTGEGGSGLRGSRSARRRSDERRHG